MKKFSSQRGKPMANPPRGQHPGYRKRKPKGRSRQPIHVLDMDLSDLKTPIQTVVGIDLTEGSPAEPEQKIRKDMYGGTDVLLTALPSCKTLEDVENTRKRWQKLFADKAMKAVDRRSKILRGNHPILTTLINGCATSAPIMQNPAVSDQAYSHLRDELTKASAENPDLEIALVTTISGDGGASHTSTTLDLATTQKRAIATLRAASPNFIGISELALFNSTSHPDGGQHVQTHEHALIWGAEVISKAKEIAKKHAKRYPSNITNARAIDVRPVEADPVNIARICAYLFKPPYRAKNWRPPTAGKPGHMNSSEKGDRNLRYLRMAQFRSMLTFDDMTFAGGEGQRIRSALIKLLRVQCEMDAFLAANTLHPDGIASFWVEVAKRLKKSDWRLPVILKR